MQILPETSTPKSDYLFFNSVVEGGDVQTPEFPSHLFNIVPLLTGEGKGYVILLVIVHM